MGARKRRLIAGARCLVAASLVPETACLVAMEALAAGTPVVAFRNGALPEVVEDGVTGFLVEDVEGMAQAIAEAGRLDPEACRAAARRRFPLARMTGAYLELYQRLLPEAAAELADRFARRLSFGAGMRRACAACVSIISFATARCIIAAACRLLLPLRLRRSWRNSAGTSSCGSM